MEGLVVLGSDHGIDYQNPRGSVQSVSIASGKFSSEALVRVIFFKNHPFFLSKVYIKVP